MLASRLRVSHARCDDIAQSHLPPIAETNKATASAASAPAAQDDQSGDDEDEGAAGASKDPAMDDEDDVDEQDEQEAAQAQGGAVDGGEPDATAVRAAIEDQRTENLEIAWESLEAAIQLFESMPDSKAASLRIADCRLALGHLQLEDEVFQGACADANKALEAYEKLLPAYDTHIAETHQVLLAAFLQAVSVEGASEEDKEQAEASALHHSRQCAAAMFANVQHTVTDGTKSTPAADVLKPCLPALQKVYNEAAELVKGTPHSMQQPAEPSTAPSASSSSSAAASSAAAPEQIVLADKLPSLQAAFESFHKGITEHAIGSEGAIAATDAATQKLAVLISDRCAIVDDGLKRAADIVSQPADDAGSSAKSLAEALVQEIAGTTTIGFGDASAAAPAAAPSAEALSDTSGLAAMLGGSSAAAAAPAAVNTLQPRKKGVKRAALEPAEGADAAKKPAQ